MSSYINTVPFFDLTLVVWQCTTKYGDIYSDDFKSRNIKLYRELNQKVAQYYEQKGQSEGKYGSLWFKCRIEHVYHFLASDNPEGFTLLNDIVNDVHEMGELKYLRRSTKNYSGIT